MRQHGNHPVYQIHACSPFQRLPVQRRILLHIIAHISDVHAQMVQSRLILIKTDRIVQILGILAVNGHHLQIPQIHTAFFVSLLHLIGNSSRLIHDLLAKFHRQIKTAHNGQNINPGIIYMSQNLHYPAFRFMPFIPVRCKFHHNFMAGDRTFGAFLRHKNIFGDLTVIRHHKAKVL